MYDFAQVRPSNLRFWQAVRSQLLADSSLGDVFSDCQLPHQFSETRSAVETSCESDSLRQRWTSPDLLLSQTCGYPYVMHLREKVSLIGTPDYGVVKDRPGWYDSVIVIRADDVRDRLEQFEGARFVLNGWDSQSGCHAMMDTLLALVGECRFFGSCTVSGAHLASLASIARSDADIAVIDSVTWRLAKRYDSNCQKLRVLCRTRPTPGLPFISCQHQQAHDLSGAVSRAIDQLPASDRDALGLKGLWRATADDYSLILERAKASAPVLAAHKGL